LPGPTGVGTADASAASTLGVVGLLAPLAGAGELAPTGAFSVVGLLVPVPLLPPPPQPARLSPSAAAMIHAILRTWFLSINF
jgi:hypothetical protein